MRCRTKCHPASLRKHDAFDEMKPQTVTRHVCSDVPSSIKRLKQLPLVRAVNARPVVDDTQPDLTGREILMGCDVNLGLVSTSSVLECIAQQILNALCQCSGVGFCRRKIRID